MEQQPFVPVYRMYCVVPYYLSDKQKGIQGHHAGQRYARKFRDDPAYIQYVEQDETLIYLDGGTSNSKPRKDGTKGSLNILLDKLNELGVNLTTFTEEDQEDALTAICFIADQRVYDKKAYPDFLSILVDPYERIRAEREHAEALGRQIYELQKLIRPLRWA